MSLLGRPKNALPAAATAADDQLSDASERFGKSYFTAPDTGSAYHTTNYLETALLSRTYFEMAEIIATCFKPARILEVGCASGPTVYHLNNHFDTEAHGVDVSKWAVENRFHPNISHAPANKLPFPDGHFDVVFSCHMLEHLTAPIIDGSIAELSRVCVPGGIQYHLLPVLGSGPYTDIFGSIVGLRKDVTHTLLYRREWWAQRWANAGWHDSGVQAGHVYDNHGFEFSECQFILTRNGLSAEATAGLARWNFDVARAYQNALVRRPRPGLEVFLNEIRDNWK
ncbi:MAG TPA: class I SAM-dependent methyltransferase [Acetobacteraceae bacterium]